MYLVLDLGNTNQKAGVFDNGNLTYLSVHERISAVTIRELFDQFPRLEAGIVSSVVDFQQHHKNMLNERLRMFIELTSHTPVPLKNHYRTPARLGKDRLASAVAGAILFNGIPTLVINAGTCITYDLVNEKSEYLGGAISPGLNMKLQALNTFTSKLPLVELEEHESVIGNSTRGSILSGVVEGTLSEIKGMINRYRKIYPNLQVILSGGDAAFLEKQLKIRIFAFPNIVMVGLFHILEHNLKNAR
jgi:type III pantothenate kinase